VGCVDVSLLQTRSGPLLMVCLVIWVASLGTEVPLCLVARLVFLASPLGLMLILPLTMTMSSDATMSPPSSMPSHGGAHSYHMVTLSIISHLPQSSPRHRP
jgi:hypothetical protein